ncbi:hypothetical protein O181_061713 [Austropuccinia psidii MF-1]|uniref:Uncharacterized protein n=1 Tax=Austropuccinia psidii MF-1 TaxID=1389203 RepID=A0A9Q3END2_9BASI|nr:hypothetical protein [Austropuccinia psidii MF-1]
MNKCAQMVSQSLVGYEVQGPQSESDQFSEPDYYDLMRHLGQPPIETNVATGQCHKDEVLAYLQNLHPMSEGKHIINYWKHQIIMGIFPNLGKIAFCYMSIVAS